jgi:hypothetical protein
VYTAWAVILRASADEWTEIKAAWDRLGVHARERLLRQVHSAPRDQQTGSDIHGEVA